MDAESLVKELILKSMTPEQQQAILDSVKTSVAQARAVQKQKIGENVDLVVQALKKIESDIRSRYDDLGNLIEKRVASIQDGRDGINGTDGRDGRDGKPGKDGAPGRQGPQGPAGKDGKDGVDGISVANAYLDFDGGLVITLSNGNEINVGEIVPMELASQIKVITNGGGTSQYVLDTLASLQTQINTLIPSQTGNSGKYLTTNGATTSWASIAGGGLSYQGTWNASTNTPTLASSTGTNGYYYIVSTAGSTNLNGITDWQVGDWLLFNGSVWQKIDQSNLVTSVNGQTGAVSLTYTDVNAIGSITSTDGSVTVSTASGVADLSVATAASTTNVVCQVRNTTGATLTKGTAVYISGVTGQLPTVSKALATSDSTSAQTLGLLSADLANNSNGYVTVIGLITNINTSSYADGDQLYLSGTTAGTLTATKPYAPTHLVYVAVVEYAHATQGKLFVKVQNGYELDEIHNVSAQSPTNGQTIVWNSSSSLWEKNTVSLTAGVNGTLPIANGGTGGTDAATARSNLAVAGTGVSNTFSANQIIEVTDNTNAALRVTQLGTGASIRVEDSANPDSTPFIIDASGNVGVGYSSPSSKLHVAGTFRQTDATISYGYSIDTSSNKITYAALYGGGYFAWQTNNSGTDRMTLDTSGNLGLGVTPSTWSVGKAFEISSGGPFLLGQGLVSDFGVNAYYNSAWLYKTSSSATRYNQSSGGHNWYTAASGTAGGTITWTQVMNLNASGALGFNGANYGSSGQVLTSGGSSAAPTWTTPTTGTVTSVAASVPSFLSISGSPITTSGTLAISYSGTALPVANGGTGVTSTPTNGQLLIGNGTGYTAATLTAGSNITITNSSGGITIASSGGGGSSGAGNAYAWFMV